MGHPFLHRKHLVKVVLEREIKGLTKRNVELFLIFFRLNENNTDYQEHVQNNEFSERISKKNTRYNCTILRFILHFYVVACSAVSDCFLSETFILDFFMSYDDYPSNTCHWHRNRYITSFVTIYCYRFPEAETILFCYSVNLNGKQLLFGISSGRKKSFYSVSLAENTYCSFSSDLFANTKIITKNLSI